MAALHNTIHIRARGAGLFDIEIFPIGTSNTIKELGLTANQVAHRVASGPEALEIRSFNEAGEQIPGDPDIDIELRKQNRAFVSRRPCPRCGGTGRVKSASCPGCRVPWK